MAESRRVVYGRINRRSIQEPLYNVRPVREELRALAESKRTAAEVDGVPWYAGDFSFDPAGDFVTGILGFSERERFQEFDEAAWSWLKGAVHEPEGASARTKAHLPSTSESPCGGSPSPQHTGLGPRASQEDSRLFLTPHSTELDGRHQNGKLTSLWK